MAVSSPQKDSSISATTESANISLLNVAEASKLPGSNNTDNAKLASQTATGAAKKSSGADEVSSPAAEEAPPADLKQTDGASEALGGNNIVENSGFDVHVKLSDLQANPNDPLYSIKSFEDLGLNENILKGIYQMRFTKPSKIQERALPLLLSNPPTNMIGQSQSGTGKTAAFVLNILSRLDMSTPEMRTAPQALCLAPTRELARQIMGVIQLMGAFVEGLTVLPAIPLEAINRGQELRGQIVVGTPGTVQDLIKKRLLRTDHIKVLVLDEADTMLDMQGLGDQCIRVKHTLPKTVQKVLFSATFPEHVTTYADRFAPNANQITLQHEELTVEGIRQLYFECAGEQGKIETLLKLYGLMTVGSSIIFVNTRATALAIEAKMTAEGHKIAQLTGAFDGSHRDAVIDEFRSGRAKVLIATNVLARGIDVQTVTLVVNYDLPRDKAGKADYETYLHRIGRTGRFGRVGVSISLVHDPASYNMLQDIGRYFAVPLSAVESDDWDAVEKTVKHVIKSSRAGANFQRS